MNNKQDVLCLPTLHAVLKCCVLSAEPFCGLMSLAMIDYADGLPGTNGSSQADTVEDEGAVKPNPVDPVQC